MTQTGLVGRIVDALELIDYNAKDTPAANNTSPKDEDVEDYNDNFNYISVLGMMLYLQGHSRPDIPFAINQCAIYAFRPKRSHRRAMKLIGRYLKGTLNKGIVMKLRGFMLIDFYVDSNFVRLWYYEESSDPKIVKSCSGFLFTLGGCPISWASILQSEITLLTVEAEYVTMRMAMKELLPLQKIVIEICKSLKVNISKQSTIKSEIWEDNTRALCLSKNAPPRTTPRSKHYAIKYHWFRKFIRTDKIGLNKIATHVQLVEILTKSLSRDKFQSLRKILMGW